MKDSDIDHIWKNPRPVLTIELTGGGQISNCYASMTYRVTSTRPLSMTDLHHLREAGCLGYGQEFYARHVRLADPRWTEPVRATHDWKTVKDEAPSGEDKVMCMRYVRATGKLIGPADDQKYKPMKMPYYVYDCENRVDSGD